jgi:biopolymer transport protein TolR
MTIKSPVSADASGLSEYRPMAEINVTPLVDVMLVLLVIFMVAAPLMVQGVPIELPKTSASKLSQPRRPMIVSLARDGSLYVRGDKVAADDLEGKLAALRADEGDTIVYVRADRGVAYGQVMEILGQVAKSGYARLSLLADPIATK